jgi:ABC transporter with metal-binding/Fe-S-binding domain ATP-binding protein
MRLAALFSGGKDSTYAAYLMEQQGHSVQVLVSVLPSDPHSMVFHTPNLHLLPLMAEAMGKGMVTVRSDGSEDGDLEALARALSLVRVEGVVTGAVASDYQWDRINGVCERLGLRTFSPLWRKGQEGLMRDLLSSGLQAMVVAVMAEGLGPEWLGRVLDGRALDELLELRRDRGVSPCGEGGEYESLVLDSPLHLRPLQIRSMSRQVTRDGGRVMVQDAVLGERGA